MNVFIPGRDSNIPGRDIYTRKLSRLWGLARVFCVPNTRYALSDTERMEMHLAMGWPLDPKAAVPFDYFPYARPPGEHSYSQCFRPVLVSQLVVNSEIGR